MKPVSLGSPIAVHCCSAVFAIAEDRVSTLKRAWNKLKQGAQKTPVEQRNLGEAEATYRKTFAAQQLMMITADARFQVDKSMTCAEHCIGVLLEIEREGNLAPSIVNASPECAKDVVSTATLGQNRAAKNLVGHEELLAEGARNLLAELRRYQEFIPIIGDVAKRFKAAKKPTRRKAA